MRWLDRTIAALSPGWGVQRAAARMALREAERLMDSSARRERVADSIRSKGRSGDFENESDLDRRGGVDRARQLEKRNPIALALLDRSTEAVCGPVGFTLQPQLEGAGAEDFTSSVKDLWAEWTPARNCDVRQLFSLHQMLALDHRAWLRDGDVGEAMLANGRLRQFESDEISDPELSSTPRLNMVDGVELDRVGAPSAFWVRDPGEEDWGTDRRLANKRTRIPADSFVFSARRQRYSQTRGLSAFSTVEDLLEQSVGSVEAVVIAHRMAACFGLAIEKATPLIGFSPHQGRAGDGSKRLELELEPGSTVNLKPGEKISQIQPAHPTTNFEGFLRLLVRLASQPFGLPLEIALLDWSQTTFSSGRGSLLQVWMKWRSAQERLRLIYMLIYMWKVINWMEEGLLEPRLDAFKVTWTMPGWQWLDPVAEIQAALLAVEAGFDTKAAIAARLGVSLDDIYAQRKKEIEAERKAGLPDVRSNLTRDPGSGASSQVPGAKTPAAAPSQ